MAPTPRRSILGTPLPDRLRAGSRKPADIVASDGDDSADGGGLADWIDGGEGNDLLRGWDGADTLAGGLGHDTLGGGAGDDRLALGAGHDLGLGGAGEDSLSGEAGEDRMFGGDGMDSLDGGDDRDTLDGGAGGDVLAGGAGDDLLRGGGGGDLLDGGDGVDLAGYRTAIGGVGVDLGAGTAWGEAAGDGLAAIEGLISSAHFDTLSGDDGGNRLVGLGGGDLLYGVGGDDTLCGGEGGDVLHGGVGDDLLAGDAGDDTLLDGGAGSERLWGGEGDDLLVHRPRAEVPGPRDTLGGGLGHDTLRLHLAPGALDDAALRADLEAQAAVLAGPAAGQQRDFAYQAIALQTHSIEHLQLVLDGADDAGDRFTVADFGALVDYVITGFRPGGVLDFDAFALADGEERAIPDGHAGFDWTQVGVYNPRPGDILGYAPTSGSNVAFLAEARGREVDDDPQDGIDDYPLPAGSPLVIGRGGTGFDAFGASFTSAFRDDLEITVEAYGDGALVGSLGVRTGGRGALTPVAFAAPGQRFTGIDELRMHAADYFGFDDLALGDRIDLRGVGGPGSLAALRQGGAVAQEGVDTLITLGGTTLRLVGVAAAGLTEADFLFA